MNDHWFVSYENTKNIIIKVYIHQYTNIVAANWGVFMRKVFDISYKITSKTPVIEINLCKISRHMTCDFQINHTYLLLQLVIIITIIYTLRFQLDKISTLFVKKRIALNLNKFHCCSCPALIHKKEKKFLRKLKR